MKKIIFFNILITLAWFPYCMERWMHMPYVEGGWSLENVMIFSSFFFGACLSLFNVLFLISLWWKPYQQHFLKAIMICLSLLFIYPIYAGIVLAWNGGNFWPDVVALGLLYGNLYLSNQVLQNFKNGNIG